MRATASRLAPVLVGATLALAVSATAAEELAPYIRLGAGISFSNDAVFADEDCAAPTNFFGCADGDDGRPIGAYGDFGESALVEGALGLEVTDWFRTEVVVGYRPFLEFEGNANFIGIPPNSQPVGADVTSLSAMLAGHVSLAPLLGWDLPLSPFVGGAIGIARNYIDEMLYRFPSLSEDSITRTQSGTHTGFAWALEGGLEYEVTDGFFASLAYRYADLGRVATDAGDILVVRPAGEFTIPTGETRTTLETQEILFSLRRRF